MEKESELPKNVMCVQQLKLFKVMNIKLYLLKEEFQMRDKS